VNGVMASSLIRMNHSRPDRRTPWQYVFFLDCAGHQADETLQKALADLKEVTTYIKVLGSYPEGE